ncbi:CBS domain-containing protein [Planctomycetota bacterium]
MPVEQELGNLTENQLSNPSPECLTPISKMQQEVMDVMHKDVVTVTVDQTALAASKIMSGNNVSCIMVMDDQSVVGVLTETDFLKSVAEKVSDFESLKLADIMTSQVISVPSDMPISKASQDMEAMHIKRLPVLDDGKLVGIVTQTDLVRAMTSHYMWRNVSDIMNTNIDMINKSATITDAAKTMSSHKFSCVIVADGNEPVGILTERDILNRIVVPQKDPNTVKVQEVMSSPIKSVPPDYSVFLAGKIMNDTHIRRLIVMEAGRLLGIVTQTDIFKAVKEKLQKEDEEALALVKESPDCTFFLDSDGVTTYANPAFMELLNISEAQMIVGKEFLPDQFWFKSEERNQLLSDLKKGYTRISELTLRTLKDNKIYVTLFTTLIKNKNHGTTGYQGVLYDITAKKTLVNLRKTEEQLRESEKNLLEHNNKLADTVQQQTADIVQTRDVTMFALAKLAESRDPETGEHLERMRSYSNILARQLSKQGPYVDLVDNKFREDLYRSSPMHDIGKVGIPDIVLLKPDRLSAGEFEIMKGHAVIGAETLDRAARHGHHGSFLTMAAAVARSHHERFNGSGYPDGLREHDIPLAARIVALADVYDALTSARVYKSPLKPEMARNMIEAEADKHFDPAIVEAFLIRWNDFLEVQNIIDSSKPELMESGVSDDLRR